MVKERQKDRVAYARCLPWTTLERKKNIYFPVKGAFVAGKVQAAVTGRRTRLLKIAVLHHLARCRGSEFGGPRHLPYTTSISARTTATIGQNERVELATMAATQSSQRIAEQVSSSSLDQILSVNGSGGR